MTAKKLPLTPAFGLAFVWFTLYVVGQFWRPTEMATDTYYQLVNNALLCVGLLWSVYVICYCLWLNNYHIARQEVMANLDAANKYIHRGIVSQRCLCDSEAEEHVLAAQRWALHDDEVLAQTHRRFPAKERTA